MSEGAEPGVRAHPAALVPPFAIGVTAAVAGELSVGLLIYSTPGFLRALTLVLAVLLGSLALGLWTIPGRGARVESIRRRWLFVLVAYAGAAAVAGGWSARGGLATTGLDRGIGLALLAGLPLYACGALLVSIAEVDDGGARGVRVAAPALAGAASGALLTGIVLIPNLVPVTIYALCLAVISGGALVHGRVLSRQWETRTLGSLPSRRGEVTVEERSWGSPRRRERILLESGRQRGAEDDRGQPLSAWERGALAWLAGRAPASAGEGPPTVFLGGGALTLPRLLLEARPGGRARVIEPNGAVLEAARLHFQAPTGDDRIAVEVASPMDAALRGECGLGIVVADARALGGAEPVPQLGRDLLDALRARMEPVGALLLGGMDASLGRGAPLEGLLREARGSFPFAAAWSTEEGAARPPSRTNDLAGELVVLLATDESLARWEQGGWTRVAAEEPAAGSGE